MWSCDGSETGEIVFENVEVPAENLLSRKWSFLSVTAFSYYSTLNLSVTERKIHVPDMKIGVGPKSELVRSGRKGGLFQVQTQVILLHLMFEYYS